MAYYLFIVFSLVLIFTERVSARDCCPSGQALLKRKDVCWDPKTNITMQTVMKCNETYRFIKGFKLHDDGRMTMSFGPEISETYEDDAYCAQNATTIRDTSFSNASMVVLMCVDDPPAFDDRVLGYCLIVSVLFLVPTALVYTALPELRDVQGKSIINFCTSLAVGQGILSMMKLMEYRNMALCATRGFLTYFFITTSFFWTNAIAIQVLLSTRRPSTLDYSWKEFKWYFLYAWGIPTILTTCMAVVNYHPGSHPKPGIGLNHCWFLNTRQQWYYMFSVLTLLLLANICIFIYISLVIWRHSFSSTHLRALKYKFVMTIRLIVLMGLPWVFEMIGSVAGEHLVWYIIDIFNCLQGLLIFLLLVVFRRRVVKLMYKHGWLDCISGYVEKHLAVEDDEENVVQHTDVPMSMGERTVL